MKRTVIGLVLLGLVAMTSGCSQKTSTSETRGGLEVPQIYAAELADQYRDLGSEGYQLLDDGKTDEAITAFEQQYELIPAGKWGAYNVACAYGRTDQLEPGLEWLSKAVNGGWDDPDHLKSDSDIASLRDDPRFAVLLKQAEETRDAARASFAEGLPEYHESPMQFVDREAFDTWVTDQKALLRKNRSVWQGGQSTAARMDFEARRLAALRELEQDNPEFDYALERVRAVGGIKSIWSAWGPFANGVLVEVDRYMGGTPTTEGKSEAHYRAGIAAFCKNRPDSLEDQNWIPAVAAARARFAKVEEGTKYFGAAEAWQITFEFDEAGENRESVLPRVREFADKFGNDEVARNIAAAFFQGEVVAATWPIPLEATDIDGKTVTLDDYQGRVVLVDFWATWCGPCRV